MEFGVAAGVLLLLSAGIVFFSFSMNTFSKRLYEGRKELKTRSASVTRFAELERARREVGTPYLNVLYNFVPKKDELINFSREVQTLANSEGLEFGFSFIGENPASEDTLGSVRFALNVSGRSEANIRNLIKKLQEFRFLIKLEEFSISNIGDGARGSIRGQVFFR